MALHLSAVPIVFSSSAGFSHPFRRSKAVLPLPYRHRHFTWINGISTDEHKTVRDGYVDGFQPETRSSYVCHSRAVRCRNRRHSGGTSQPYHYSDLSARRGSRPLKSHSQEGDDSIDPITNRRRPPNVDPCVTLDEKIDGNCIRDTAPCQEVDGVVNPTISQDNPLSSDTRFLPDLERRSYIPSHPLDVSCFGRFRYSGHSLNNRLGRVTCLCLDSLDEIVKSEPKVRRPPPTTEGKCEKTVSLCGGSDLAKSQSKLNSSPNNPVLTTKSETSDPHLTSQDRPGAQSPASSLTGNMMRDFPEDFGGVWKPASCGTYSKMPDNGDLNLYGHQPVAVNQHASQPELSIDLPISLPRGSASSEEGSERLQQALERQQWRVDAARDRDLEPSLSDSTSPSIRNLGNETPVVKYDISSSTAAPTGRETSLGQAWSHPADKTGHFDTVVYKILAYDPTMQCVDIAETVSSVPGSATALTPAEALVRLSNPSKFFPHFAPLQAEGYEIESGSGDVLIFRKVREATTVPLSVSSTSTGTPAESHTNPIQSSSHSVLQPSKAGHNLGPASIVHHKEPFIEEPDEDQSKIAPLTRSDPPSMEGVEAWSREYEALDRPDRLRRRRRSLGKKLVIVSAFAIGYMAFYLTR